MLIANFVFITSMVIFVNNIYKLYFVEIIGEMFSQFIMVSISEELVFRVGVSEILSKNTQDTKKRIIVSSLFFGAMHLLVQINTIDFMDHWIILKILLIPIILGGILAVVYELTGDLLLLITIHGTYNVLAGLSVGVYKNVFCISYIMINLILCIYIILKRKEEYYEKNII